MIVRRAVAAGIAPKLGCHTVRATGITVYLLDGGLVEDCSRWRRIEAHDHQVVRPAQ